MRKAGVELLFIIALLIVFYIIEIIMHEKDKKKLKERYGDDLIWKKK